jgi:hypothetical protein
MPVSCGHRLGFKERDTEFVHLYLANNQHNRLTHLYAGGLFVLRRQSMTKVRILTTCSHCGGKAYLPINEAIDTKGEPYTQYQPCPMCEGSGMASKWISLQEFAILLAQTQCPHQHTSYKGSLRFSAGNVWDDLCEVCNDCSAVLDRQTIGDYIHDPETIHITK